MLIFGEKIGELFFDKCRKITVEAKNGATGIRLKIPRLRLCRFKSGRPHQDFSVAVRSA